MPRTITVRVPATTANLGPGFDCLGLALDFYNEVTAASARRFRLDIEGEGETSLDRTQRNLVYRSLAAVYEKAGQPVPPLAVRCRNVIPLKRGLGSSAAAIVGGVVAGNHLLGEPFALKELLGLAAQLEGHPDNVAPALLGGLQVVVKSDSQVIAVSVPLPARLQAVLFIPDLEISTARARAVLPQRVSLEDAVFNVGRASLLVAALAAGDLEALRVATQDRLHQPARQALFPALPLLVQAALQAGALGAFLSGAGSTVLALARERPGAIAEAMAQAAHEARLSGQTRNAGFSLSGVQVTLQEGP